MCIARDGEPQFDAPAVDDTALRCSVNVPDLTTEAFAPVWSGGAVKVIEVYPDLLLTGSLVAEPRVEEGRLAADPARDLLLAACLERHHGTGAIGVGLVKGFGLQRGALASTVGHDSHNITVVGVTPAAMRRAVEAVVAAGGGLAAADDEQVLRLLPLPLAGLMSDLPVREVAAQRRALAVAAEGLGTALPDPFMTLSFVSLSVIPALRLTPRGLVDVNRFVLVGLEA